jgi:hypothetical protein
MSPDVLKNQQMNKLGNGFSNTRMLTRLRWLNFLLPCSSRTSQVCSPVFIQPPSVVFARIAVHLILSSVVTLPMRVVANPASITLEGDFSYSLYQGNVSALFSANYKFKAELSGSGCSWIIHYEDVAARTNADLLDGITTASCDGTNIYVVHIPNEIAVKKAWGDKFAAVRGELPAAMVSIYSGAYPPPKEPPLQHLWLALASHCLIGEKGGKTKPPYLVDMAIFEKEDFSCDYYWEINNNDPTVRKLVLKSDGRTWRRDPVTGAIENLELAPPFDKGYTRGEGVWRKGTNVGGIFLPLEYEFTGFLPVQQASNQLKVSFINRCIVNSVHGSELAQIPTPLPEGKVLVDDRRFADQGNAIVSYTVSNRWPRKTDSELQSLVASKSKETTEQEVLRDLGLRTIDGLPIRSSKKRIVVILLIAFPSLLVFSWLLYTKVGITNKNQ